MLVTHTHTHTLAIAMLMLLQSVVGNAQVAGAFSILSLQNLPTHTECIIAWEDNTITTAIGLNIEVVVSGTSACVEPTLSIIDPYFDDPANGFTVTFSNSGVRIRKIPIPNNPFDLATDYSPLVTLAFLSDPGTNATVTASGFVIESGFSGPLITSTSATVTAPSGFNLFGQIWKAQSGYLSWQNCSGFSDIVPGVTVAVVPVLQQQHYTLSAGTNSLVLDNIPQASGIYTASIQTRFGIQNLRFVKS